MWRMREFPAFNHRLPSGSHLCEPPHAAPGLRASDLAIIQEAPAPPVEWGLPPHHHSPGVPVARVVVDVMLKPEILDPQGQAVQRALPRLGFAGIADVRQGKRFELELDGPVDDAALARIREAAETFLANTVIEDFTVRVEEK